MNETGNDWDEWLSFAVFMYNASVQPSVGEAPVCLFLNRGRSARLPVDAGIVGAAKSTSVFEFVKKMMVRMDMAKKAAFECAQEKTSVSSRDI